MVESTQDPTVTLAQQLIAYRSVSPDQSGAQDLLVDRLARCGFSIHKSEFFGCKSFWARLGIRAPLIVFSGHTDVVPAGDEASWRSPPFGAAIKDGMLFGRGAADMKGSVAAMVTAVEAFLSENQKELPFSIGFLITGDEEIGGAAAGRFLEEIATSSQKIEYCIVGEPTSEIQLGDTIKIGRRGSLRGELTIFGKQGHVGYPHLAENAIHTSFAPLMALTTEKWDSGSEYFDPTTFQITSISGGVANNVIPGEVKVEFNFRFGINSSPESLQRRMEEILGGFVGLRFHLNCRVQAQPFLTQSRSFQEIVSGCIKEVLGVTPKLSTSGGTSDARYFAKTGAQVLEFGPLNKTIHQVDEHVGVGELVKVSEVYKAILRNIVRSL